MAIVKILARHSPSYASLIRYILNEDKSDKMQVFTNNLRSDNIPGYVQEFIENETFRQQSRTDHVYLYHEIISFHADENKALLSPEVLDDLVQEYIRLRGHTGVMIGAVHHDQEHVHVHFCVSALHFRTGLSFGLSKAQLHELKHSFQEYHQQRYPGIDKSTVEHGKAMPYLRHGQWHANQRELIAEMARRCFAEAKSQQQFFELLRARRLDYYERHGRPAGVEANGVKMSFSRLLADMRLDALPVERSEEEQALQEIRRIRERQAGRDREERDWEERAR
ncbi:relaxase/mobilization nuclease domain-containing protein [Mucilaginibacter rubeus]|uniref:Relaxase/mobilization nuclease domain-containing protein n=1 Tax=Mucilaginibacter rubeus TaxID=2027860 RepID=A0A5C1I3Y6_9SPHI|nr:relaxase/mobilization nuclease domain-containing protein [Mucilaginibacter rubeus]QEM12972.1 relaxase/mobilization nuclease domain-containing protein [Mucilaginibacter rubeus]